MPSRSEQLSLVLCFFSADELSERTLALGYALFQTRDLVLQLVHAFFHLTQLDGIDALLLGFIFLRLGRDRLRLLVPVGSLPRRFYLSRAFGLPLLAPQVVFVVAGEDVDRAIRD